MTRLSEETIDGIHVLHLSGSLAQEGLQAIVPALAALRATRGACAVIDMAHVTAITTPAISLLLRTMRSLEAGGGKLVLANLNGLPRDVFATCRLDRVFVLAERVELAVKLAQKTPPLRRVDAALLDSAAPPPASSRVVARASARTGRSR